MRIIIIIMIICKNKTERLTPYNKENLTLHIKMLNKTLRVRM